jgi:sialidase-1
MNRNFKYYRTNFLLLVILCSLSSLATGKGIQGQLLWKTGEGNYKGYRIPSVVVSTKGTVLAFAEGRNDGGDSGDIDLVLRRSGNSGRTWGPEIVVWNEGLNTCGNAVSRGR